MIAEQTEQLRKLFRDLGRDITEADARDSVTLFWREPAMHPSPDIDKREIQAPLRHYNSDVEGEFHEAANEKHKEVAGCVREIFHDMESDIAEEEARESASIFSNDEPLKAEIHEPMEFPVKIGSKMVTKENFIEIKRLRETGMFVNKIAVKFDINDILFQHISRNVTSSR